MLFWRPDVLWLNVLSDGGIAFSYYAIPLILLFFLYKRKDFPFPWILAMFGAFILLCGTTHIMSIVTIWNPLYRLDGVIKAATAIISLITMVVLIPLIPLALALRSPKELEAANLKLEDANDKLKEIDRLKDDFFSNISHELRTPLTLLLAPLESLLAYEYGPLSDKQRIPLETMHNNSIRLFQMVNSILDFAKISAKKIEVRREPLDLVLLTKAITSEFKPILKQKNIQINFICPFDKKIVHMDRYLYERILFNLLSNAAKFTQDNGSIEIKLDFDNNKAKLAVKDTGIGISKEDQKKLFQRFQQVEGSATRRFEGTGLGLALIKEFTLLLGGDVLVESQTNQGSTFTIEIAAPITEEILDEKIKPLASQFQKFEILKKEEVDIQNTTDLPKILIAEDNLELAQYITSLLSDIAQIKHAVDGEEALAMVNSWHPNIVLLDIMMPKRDGISVCNEIKTNAKTMQTTVVLLTALTHRNALMRGWEAGADEYLFKPFHPTELKTRLKLLLSHAEHIEKVKELNRKLISSARLVGMSEVSEFIVHNIGNILNSINVTANFLLEKLNTSKIKEMELLIDWIETNLANPEEFTKNNKQADLLLYIQKLYHVLLTENKSYLTEVRQLNDHIQSIKEIIALQDKYRENFSGIIEPLDVLEILDECLALSLETTFDIEIIKEYHADAKVFLDKIKLQQILLSLIQHAIRSFQDTKQTNKKLTLSVMKKREEDKEFIEIKLIDNCAGISEEDLQGIFTFGSTSKEGIGLDLHISAISAKQMGGSLTAHSLGKGKGSTFTLKLPLKLTKVSSWIESM